MPGSGPPASGRPSGGTPAVRFAAASLLVLLLAGCSVAAVEPAVAPSATGVTRSTEQGGKFIALVGPRRPHAEPFLGVAGTNFYALRSWIDTRNGETAHQLYVEDSYFGAERNWDSGQDEAGRPLRFVAISKNEITCENGCSYAEEFAASFPESYLRERAAGLTVSFGAKSGAQKTIAVPGDLVARQLDAVAEARATLPTASVLAPPAR